MFLLWLSCTPILPRGETLKVSVRDRCMLRVALGHVSRSGNHAAGVRVTGLSPRVP
jgi:hypothetical protein